MTSDPTRPSRRARVALVLGLWLTVLLLLALMARGFVWLTSRLNVRLESCLLVIALVIVFSMLAGAIHLSADTLRGRYPYAGVTGERRATNSAYRATKGQLGTRNPVLGNRDGAVVSRRRPRWRTGLDALVIAAITVVLSLVLLEVGLRIFAPQQSVEMRQALQSDIFAPDAAAVFSNMPGADSVLNSTEFSSRMLINSQGLREDHEIGTPVPGVTRILCIGDSYTFGYGVNADQAFPHLLSGNGIEAINAGVSAYGPDNEAAWLHAHGWQFKPDIVLVGFFVGNDITDAYFGMRKVVADERGNLRAPQDDSGGPLQEVGGWLALNSHAYVFLRGLLSSAPKAEERPVSLPYEVSLYPKEEPPQITEGWQKAFAALDSIKSDVEAHGAKLVVAVFPMPEQTVDASWQGMISYWKLNADQLQRNKPQLRISDWADRAGVPTIDLLPGFSSATGGPYYFSTTWHWNSAGHVLAARIIMDGLLRLGFVPR